MATKQPPFPSVGLLSPLAPVDHPQTLPSSPHRLPPLGERPAKRLNSTLMGGMGPSTLSGAPVGAVDTNTFEAHRYATIIEQNIPVPTAATGVPFLTETSGKRNFLGLRNASAAGGANVYIGFGRDASAASWLALTPGQMILFDTVVPQDDLYSFGDAAGGLLSFAFSSYNPSA